MLSTLSCCLVAEMWYITCLARLSLRLWASLTIWCRTTALEPHQRCHRVKWSFVWDGSKSCSLQRALHSLWKPWGTSCESLPVSLSPHLQNEVPNEQPLRSSGWTVLIQTLYVDAPQVPSTECDANLHPRPSHGHKPRLTHLPAALRRHSRGQIELIQVFSLTQNVFMAGFVSFFHCL